MLARDFRDDLKAHGLVSWKFIYRFSERPVYFQLLLRRTEALRRKAGASVFLKLAYVQSRFRLERLGERLGYSIPPGVFGPGLRIAHAGTIVVNPRVVVGPWCTVHQGVTLGSSGGLVPTVGSNVWIGPGAQIFGDIRIGDGAVIGANAVVNRDVPSGAFMAGVPARVVGQAADLGNAPVPLE